jgi:hypothetical protein
MISTNKVKRSQGIPTPSSHQIEFHPVGQGLFVTGRISSPAVSTSLNWVYDCGAERDSISLNKSIQQYRAGAEEPLIDLLAISHFHHDHVRGIDKLLQGQRVRTIALPYATLAQRMIFALTNGGSDSRYLNFLANPGQYFASIAGIGEPVVFYISREENDVSDQNAPPPDQRTEQFDDSGLAPAPGSYRVLAANATAGEPYRRSYVVSQSNSLTPSNTSLDYEFLFYNEEFPEIDVSILDDDIKKLIDSFDHDQNGLIRFPSGFISEIEKIYAKIFGPAIKNPARITQKYANGISLAMLVNYTGTSDFFWYMSAAQGFPSSFSYRSTKARMTGILLTGDICFGKISSPNCSKLIRCRDHYSSVWDQIFAMQVPHHGSALSWPNGGISYCNHQVSVFCFGLHNRYSHPGHGVFSEFFSHCRIRVTEQSDLLLKLNTK